MKNQKSQYQYKEELLYSLLKEKLDAENRENQTRKRKRSVPRKDNQQTRNRNRPVSKNRNRGQKQKEKPSIVGIIIKLVAIAFLANMLADWILL